MFSLLCCSKQPLSSCSYPSDHSPHNTGLEIEILDELSKKFTVIAQKDPVLLLVGGFQGSGKSSLINRIKKIFATNIISTDAIRQSLLNRGVKVSPEFSASVNRIYWALVKKSLSTHSHTIIDANAHAKRLQEIEELLAKEQFKHRKITIFLNTSEKTLRNRLQTRQPLPDCYEGTEKDLDASLASSKLNLEDYDLVIDTDQMNEWNVYELVSHFLSYHLKINHVHLKDSILHLITNKDDNFISYLKEAIRKITQAVHHRVKTDPSFQTTWKSTHLEVEHEAITMLDTEILEPKRRSFRKEVDRSPEHLPYAHNQFLLKDGRPVSASYINLSVIDPACPTMIAAQAPMPTTISLFWSMVAESRSNLIVMLTDLVEEIDLQRHKVKCTRYWPERVRETLFLEGHGKITLIHREQIFSTKDEELWHSKLHITVEGVERTIDHFWLRGWKDGKGLNSLELQHLLLERIHQHVNAYPDCPPIIHCSAGVGRTGTVIGSYLAKHLLAWSPSAKEKSMSSKKALPLEITLYLRYQRSHLIHTLDQYLGLNRFIQSIEPKKEKAAKQHSLALPVAIIVFAVATIAILKSKK